MSRKKKFIFIYMSFFLLKVCVTTGYSELSVMRANVQIRNVTEFNDSFLYQVYRGKSALESWSPDALYIAKPAILNTEPCFFASSPLTTAELKSTSAPSVMKSGDCKNCIIFGCIFVNTLKLYSYNTPSLCVSRGETSDAKPVYTTKTCKKKK